MKEKTRILIAYDGSNHARAAIDDLGRAGLPREVHALVVAVTDLLFAPPSPGMAESTASLRSRRVTAAVAQAQAQAAEGLTKAHAQAVEGCHLLQSLFPEWRVEAEALAGDPGWEIVQKADAWHADLIVVGSQGRSALGRLILGSVSTKVAQEANCSVRIGRAAYESHAMKNEAPVRIVIGVDDTPDARAAVEAVANRTWTHGSEARIICVNCQLSPTWTSKSVPHAVGIIEADQEEARKKQKMLDEAAGILRESRLTTLVEMINGDPQRVLLEEAVRVHADCIFVGSRGISGIIERFRLDSISLGVATKASCSVEIVWTC